ncbi:hypothetical protein SAMN04490202_4254 [Pseudomonas reinekei]|jgi:hypothetical protein|uniref:Uncharacterized protein n=1 Tax=Pseudomonas reinekei TaxID=395598 RepID=A0A1H0SPS9_PSERE|nr:hypothetical protein SAMN04490202_4254 [Pseudomonas reinekei]
MQKATFGVAFFVGADVLVHRSTFHKTFIKQLFQRLVRVIGLTCLVPKVG